ncbi:iron ABC transporter permease [Hellea sp.]|nr:iron ABC transporter permease [Hellea sp.]
MKLALLILGTITVLLISLFFGAADLSVSQTLSALFGQGREIDITIVQELRLPRALLGAVIGAGLGASGAALQGYTRNPLAAPGILGFTACAALGAVTALYFGFNQLVPLAALIGTALGALLILKIAGPRKGASTLILAGVGVGALATALTGLIMNFAPNPWALSEIVYWLMGSLKNAEMGGLMVCAPLTALGLALLLFVGPDLRTLSLGEETATSLGVSLGKVRILLIAGTALCVGSGVAIAGAIGFIGLFVPHIVRLIFGPDPMKLIPLSALGGAGFLVFADIITRALTGPGTQLYLGILTSLIGVPFFLYLAVKETRT